MKFMLKSDLAQAVKKLIKIQSKLNNSPKKYGYKTPNEILDFELKNVA